MHETYGAEFAENETPNARLNRALEAFNYGPATIGVNRESTPSTEPTIPAGTPVTHVFDLKNNRSATYYQQPETGIQVIQIADETASSLITHGYWIKHDATAPLIYQSYIGGYAGALAREATDEEVTTVADHLDVLNQWYARTRETDLSSPTERRLRKAITNVLSIDPQPSIINVEKTGGKDGGTQYTTVTILNHDLYLKVLGHDNHDQPTVHIELDGVSVPENLRQKIIRIESPGEIHGVFDDRITYGGTEPKNLLFYPDKPLTETPGKHPTGYPLIQEPDATLKEADAEFLVHLLEGYSQGQITADAAHERRTPVDAVTLNACRQKLGALLLSREAKDDWKFQGDKVVFAQLIKSDSSKRRFRRSDNGYHITLYGDPSKEDYTVSVGGDGAPDSLRSLYIGLNYGNSDFHVRPANEAAAQQAGFPSRMEWLVSQLQIRELVDFINNNS